MQYFNWKSAIKKFDEDLYKYLLEKYHYNKSLIAKKLDVSLLTVVKKTTDFGKK